MRAPPGDLHTGAAYFGAYGVRVRVRVLEELPATACLFGVGV